MKKIRWGLLAASNIAKGFANALKSLEDAEIAAVGSRSLEKAQAFAQTHGIPKAYGSYEELVADPDIDVIYVSTPHAFHLECVLMSLRAGKPVLCEKPFAINAREVEEAIKVARENNVFLMEAMWSRFLPIYAQVFDWLKQGFIGELRHVKATFGFATEFNPKARLFNHEIGGGALLDVGVYPVAFLSLFLGLDAKEIKSVAHIGESGVDEVFSAILSYPAGQTAVLEGAIRADMQSDAWLCGTTGKIKMVEFLKCQTATLYQHGKEPVTVDCPFTAGFRYEAAEVMTCIREGKLESSIMPLQETLQIARTLDAIRSTWGLVYPADLR